MSPLLERLTRFTYTEQVPIDHAWRRRNLEIINYRLRELVRAGYTLPRAKSIIEKVFGLKFL